MKIESFLQKSLIIPTLFMATQLEARLQQKISAHGLSTLEALILVAILFEGRDCRPSELATNLRASRVRISQSLKKLIEKGFIDRKLERQDARFIAVRITVPGKTPAVKLVGIFDKLNHSIEKQLGAKNAEQAAVQLFTLLRATDQNLQIKSPKESP